MVQISDVQRLLDMQTAAARLLEGLGVPRKAVPVAAEAGGAATEVHIRREIRQDDGMLRSRCVQKERNSIDAVQSDTVGDVGVLRTRCLPTRSVMNIHVLTRSGSIVSRC